MKKSGRIALLAEPVAESSCGKGLVELGHQVRQVSARGRVDCLLKLGMDRKLQGDRLLVSPFELGEAEASL